MDDAKQFGPAVRTLRQAHGLQQNEVARGSGVDGQNVYRIEHGKRQPTLETALKISRFLEQATGVAILTFNPKETVE